ncbi:hypothetical protein [Shewanella sp. SM74]|uniref:hypothetical protein n=1 Tax=Shewanella sp. SM74 TaxID=2912807 RepID=UPI0021DA7FFD|nr:hypothetical protein [Shewanella sp. SM74]MCU8012505.1 hypothetical protein [Shewanella sp. SM74]
MSLTIKPNKQQALNIQNQVMLASLPAKKRIRVLKKLGTWERAETRKRIRQQTTVEGTKFEARASKSRVKMLRKLGKTLEPYVYSANRLELKHKNTLTGKIAAFQQFGGSETMTAAKMAKKDGPLSYDDPCTKRQAKALANEGYKIRRAKGKNYRRATINEIMARMKMGQAGLILRLMRDKRDAPRTWEVNVSPRGHLGSKTARIQDQLLNIIEKERQKRG